MNHWRRLVDGLGDREADVMVEAKGKEHALIPMSIKCRCLATR